jgi:hypothetical protein
MRERANTRSLDALVFYCVLLAFTAALVIDMWGLHSGARLVPQIVAWPTLAALVLQLFFDLFPASREGPRPSERSEEPDERGRRRRELLLGAWVLAFFALSWIVGFLLSVPIALIFFLKVLNGDPWRLAISVTAATWAGLYLIFGVLLDVPL